MYASLFDAVRKVNRAQTSLRLIKRQMKTNFTDDSEGKNKSTQIDQFQAPSHMHPVTIYNSANSIEAFKSCSKNSNNNQRTAPNYASRVVVRRGALIVSAIRLVIEVVRMITVAASQCVRTLDADVNIVNAGGTLQMI